MSVQGTGGGERLQEIAAEVLACHLCRLCTGRANAVPGEGPPSAAVMFIGEGPGFNEDQQGRPFVGRAGKLLDELLGSVPLQRSDVFITNVVKCRPPDNRDPQPDEVEKCWPYLERQIAVIRPRVIATLGRHSLHRFFPEAKISRDHGRALRWRDCVVYPLYHPAAALRSASVMQELADDIRKLPQAVLEALTFEAGAATKRERPAGAYVRPTPQEPAKRATTPVPPPEPTRTGVPSTEAPQKQLPMF